MCFVLLPVIFPYRGGRMWALSSESKIDHADITFNITYSFHLTSWRRLVLIQKLAAQIPEVFYQPRIAEKAAMI